MSRNSDYEEVLKVNQKFYDALGTRDLELMDAVWVKDARAGCVHPGWIMLRGWESIKQSWENVFDPEDQVDIKLSDVTVEIKGDVAWVTCIQQLVYLKRDPMMISIAQSTNIFERRGSRWLMVIHHASPVPIANYEVTEETKLQ